MSLTALQLTALITPSGGDVTAQINVFFRAS